MFITYIFLILHFSFRAQYTKGSNVIPIIRVLFFTSLPSIIMENKPRTIAEIAVANPSALSTLTDLLKLAGLVDVLNSPGQFTVFAPTNAAFAKLDRTVVAQLTRPENKDKLKDVLLFHVLGSVVPSSAIGSSLETPATLEGKNLAIYRDDSGTVHVCNAKVLQADINATNGVIHAIDTVLIPSTSCMAKHCMAHKQ